MPSTDKDSQTSENRLLGSLSANYFKLLSPDLEFLELPLGKILYTPKQQIEQVYFPRRSAVSMVNILEDGSMVEVGVVGREGMVGASLTSGDDLSAHQAIVQIADGGWRLNAAIFKRDIENNGELARIARRYSQALFTQVAQTAACNRMHPIEKRLARWLLLMRDRMESDVLQLTHEFIATMLGTRRAGVSIAAGKLQTAGIIHYHRGKVTILSRRRLEDASCECHRVVSVEYDRLLGKQSPVSRRKQ